MSKFRTRMRGVGRTPAGFSFGAHATARHILVVAEAADAVGAGAAVEAGVDAVLLRRADALGGTRAKGVAGLWLEAADAAAVTQARDDGADFFVFDDGRAAASALTPTEIGRVLVLGPDQDAERLRTVAALDLDAVLVEAVPGPLTVRDQLALRRVAMLTGAPLLIAAAGEPDTASLTAWRDAGALAVLVTGDAAALRRAVAAADAVPAPPRRDQREGGLPLVGTPAGGGHHHHDDDDDDDDDR